jgi:hypothetical protein
MIMIMQRLLKGLIAGIFAISITLAFPPSAVYAQVDPCTDNDDRTICRGPGEIFVDSACLDNDPATVCNDPCFDNDANTACTDACRDQNDATICANQAADQDPCLDENSHTVCEGDSEKIYDWLKTGINFLSMIVGVVVVMMIIIGGIQYSSANGDPKKIAAAKSRVYNALLALVAYLFIFSFLQWLIPGGIF